MAKARKEFIDQEAIYFFELLKTNFFYSKHVANFKKCKRLIKVNKNSDLG